MQLVASALKYLRAGDNLRDEFVPLRLGLRTPRLHALPRLGGSGAAADVPFCIDGLGGSFRFDDGAIERLGGFVRNERDDQRTVGARRASRVAHVLLRVRPSVARPKNQMIL